MAELPCPGVRICSPIEVREKGQRIITIPAKIVICFLYNAMPSFNKRGVGGCPIILLTPAFVILSEAKNLMDSGTYTSEILRLAPQNDVSGQALWGDLVRGRVLS